MIKGDGAFGHLDRVSGEQFAAAWNAAASLDDVAARVRELVGPPVPRWWVLARVGDYRRQGLALKDLPGERRDR